jgi:spore maturation protein SpmB
MIADVLALLLVNGLLLAAGAGLTRAIGVWTRPSELQTVVATALLVGICAFGVAAQLI